MLHGVDRRNGAIEEQLIRTQASDVANNRRPKQNMSMVTVVISVLMIGGLILLVAMW